MTDSEKMDLILTELQGMKSEIQGTKSEIQGMKSEIQGTKSEIQGTKSEIQGMKSEIQEMKSALQKVKEKVVKMDLTLENEIRVNIQRVAEGHLDLSRNLHEAMKPSSEVEMLAIKVRQLETDVRDLKQRIS